MTFASTVQKQTSAAGDLGFDDEAGASLVAAAIALRPLLASKAQRHEDEGELSPEVVDALDKAGFWKMAVPRRWGGLAISANYMARVAAEAGAAILHEPVRDVDTGSGAMDTAL